MSNLVESASWDPVFQLERTTPADAGAGGIMNAQAQALLNRFAYLAAQSGASKVGFSQPGLNYVQRTAEQKLRDVVDAQDYTTLAAAFTSANEVRVTTAINVTTNTTIPKGKKLVIAPGGTITVSAGITLTIRCVVDAPLRQVFAGSGSVIGIREVYPEWWGAVGTGAVDDIAALDASHTCVQASQTSEGEAPTIWLRSVQYGVSRSWIVRPTAYVPLRVKGNGVLLAGSRIIALSTFTPAGPAFQIAGSTDSIEMIADWELSGVSVFPSAGGYGACTIGLQIGSDGATTKLIGYHQNKVENVLVSGFPTCTRILHTRLVQFTRFSCWNAGFPTASTCLLIEQQGGSTGDFKFVDCQFVASSPTTANTHALAIKSSNGAYSAITGANQVSGITFEDCDFYSGWKSVYLYAGSTSWLTDIWFVRPQVDQQTTNGFWLESNNSGSNLENVRITDGYISETLGDAVVLTATGTAGTIQSVDVVGNWMERTIGACVNAVGTTVQGLTVDNNKVKDSQSTDAVFTFNGTKGFTCTNNKSVRPLGGTHSAYFIKLLSGCNNFVVANNVSGGVTSLGVVSDASGAVTKALSNNI